MSVINYVDEILLWDTGSADGTLDIIEAILSTPIGKKKVKFSHFLTKSGFREDVFRQKMLDITDSDWIFVVDGDEIWWDDSVKRAVEIVKGEGSRSIESLVVPTINLLGDIFHRQDESAGRFKLAGRKGHLNLRFVKRTIPGLKSFGRDWDWGWIDGDGQLVQNRDESKSLFVDAPYLHATHLPRAGGLGEDQKVYRRNYKFKCEIGRQLSRDFYYPEAFFRPRPEMVPSPWIPMNLSYKLNAVWQTPLKKLKRILL